MTSSTTLSVHPAARQAQSYTSCIKCTHDTIHYHRVTNLRLHLSLIIDSHIHFFKSYNRSDETSRNEKKKPHKTAAHQRHVNRFEATFQDLQCLKVVRLKLRYTFHVMPPVSENKLWSKRSTYMTPPNKRIPSLERFLYLGIAD